MCRQLWAFLAMSFVLSACSPQDWKAKLAIFQAESALDKANELKERKIPFEQRKVYYAQACRHFAGAYASDPNVFTLNRIEAAADSCWKGGDADKEEIFKQFEEVYIKKHPTEYEHGDSGVNAVDMGG